jgi:capsular exopolysaccharide synthesis family protein
MPICVKPNVHHLARLRNNYGLSTVIATNRSWRQVVQSANVKGCLNVITSGPLPPNPMVLLESTKMTKLLQVWRQAYDYVLIDTPPIVGITDAQCLASKVDSVVLVAAIERSTRSAIASSLSRNPHDRAQSCQYGGDLDQYDRTKNLIAEPRKLLLQLSSYDRLIY